jgi:O-antigen/teichoic acid export membrane protein
MWLLTARRPLRVAKASDAESLRESLALGLPFLLTGVAVALYSRGDRLVLALLGDSTATGLYTAAYTIAFGASLLGSAIQVMALPHALREHAVRGATWITVRRRLLLAWCPSLAVVALTALYAKPIVHLLFGTAFAGSAPLLIALSPIIPMYVMNPYLATLLVAARREAVVTRIAFINLALASVLFPIAVLSGGALYLAVASVAVEVSGHIQMLIAVKRLLRGDGVPRDGSTRSL